eukprot:6214829-Pleurochrysis_carterae.AAC.3
MSSVPFLALRASSSSWPTCSTRASSSLTPTSASSEPSGAAPRPPRQRHRTTSLRASFAVPQSRAHLLAEATLCARRVLSGENAAQLIARPCDRQAINLCEVSHVDSCLAPPSAQAPSHHPCSHTRSSPFGPHHRPAHSSPPSRVCMRAQAAADE